MPGYRYPREAPHWVEATRVERSSVPGYVKVWVGDINYGLQRVRWDDPYMNKDHNNCLIEDPENGWLAIWWQTGSVTDPKK